MIKAFLKIFFIALIIYISFLVLLAYLVFIPTSQNVIEKNTEVQNTHIKLYEHQIYLPILNIEYANINEITEEFIRNSNITSLEIKLDDYFITTENILAQSSNIKSKDWVLGDISIDNKYGELKKVSDHIFQFIKNDEFYFSSPIKIKFQALNEADMQNSISTISFNLPEFFIEYQYEPNFFESQLKNILQLEHITYKKTFELPQGQKIATFKLSYHQDKVVHEIYTSLLKIFIIYNIVFFIVFALYFLVSYLLVNSFVIQHLKKLKIYMSDIENNKFYKYNTKQLKNTDVIEIADATSKLSKKMASIINELNVNKDLLEQQISLDSLTKLPNRKMFESELKSLFITHIDSYIGKIKLVSLASYAKDKNQDHIDSFIQDFARTTLHSFEKYGNKYALLYRLYGSEFVFIVKHSNFDQISDIFEHMDEIFEEFAKEHEIETKLFHGVSIPLYKYTSIPKINKDLDELYESTIDKKKSHFVVDNADIDQENEKLENTIRSIVKNNAFTISKKFDTYNFDEEPELLMQEISPNLIDTEGKVIPIGTFISVAETLDIAIEFDKNVIIKALRDIRKQQHKHELAVNISISSMCDDAFLTWLEGQILYEYKDVVEHIVFSITSFAANTNFEKFADFTQRLKRFNGKVLLKRYNYNDLSMDQLETLYLNYIRVHKDYTTNIDHEREVILRNMVSFANLNKIHVLGDVVSNKLDYQTIHGLRFYGTSR